MLTKLKKLWMDMGPLNAGLYLIHRELSTLTTGRAGIERFCFDAQPVPAKPYISPSKTTSSIVKPLQPGDPLLVQCMRPRVTRQPHKRS